jgi:hypothetical protein
MEPEALCEYVASKLELYVMDGELSPEPFASAIAEAAEDLLLLHYLLDEDTIEFARGLPPRLRNLRTGTDTEAEIVHSEVDSRIDWGATVQRRYARNPNDPTLFVTQSRYEEYDLDENIVLKAVLNRLDTGLETWGTELNQYGWRDWAGGSDDESASGEELLSRTRRLISANINLGRIRDPKRHEPTAKMLETAARSRHALYRDAAERYLHYGDIVTENPDRELLKELLRETLIIPLRDAESSERRHSTLFELYALFRVIESLETTLGISGELAPIRRGRNAVAGFELDNGDRIRVYYEQAAGNDGLSFLGSTDSLRERDLTRRELIQQRTNEITTNLLGRSTRAATDRPDVLVVYEHNGEVIPELTLVIEVKYQGSGTSGRATIKRGVREVLEYLSYARFQGELITRDFPHTVEADSVPTGLLVINDVESESEEFRSDEMQIVSAASLASALPSLLEVWLESDWVLS